LDGSVRPIYGNNFNDGRAQGRRFYNRRGDFQLAYTGPANGPPPVGPFPGGDWALSVISKRDLKRHRARWGFHRLLTLTHQRCGDYSRETPAPADFPREVPLTILKKPKVSIRGLLKHGRTPGATGIPKGRDNQSHKRRAGRIRARGASRMGPDAGFGHLGKRGNGFSFFCGGGILTLLRSVKAWTQGAFSRNHAIWPRGGQGLGEGAMWGDPGRSRKKPNQLLTTHGPHFRTQGASSGAMQASAAI